MCDIIQLNEQKIINSDYNNVNFNIDFSRTDNICDYKYETNKSDTHITNDKHLIYRFKFQDEFSVILYKFAKLHQYDSRQDFKEAWKEWVDDNEETIMREESRLQELGYEGKVKDKMFKSARYYFRKKSTEKPLPKNRKKYIGLSKHFINIIDEHIKNGLSNSEMKPSDGYNNFIETNNEEIESENIYLKNNEYNKEEITNKLKKTYKNRYFIYKNK